jgi:hypothetical protein
MTPNASKPRMMLSVGITGHRPNKMPRHIIPRIERHLREVMAAIDTIAAKHYRDHRDLYAEGPAGGTPRTDRPYRIRLISGFAEGADQLAVAACPADWIVEAILPFPKDEYLKDFATSAASDGRDVRNELLASLRRASAVTELTAPPGRPRHEAYAAAGRAMLDAIDILIAVWDGEEPEPGGTGTTAKEGYDGGIPVVWLSTRNDLDPVLIERFADGRPIAAATPWAAALSLPDRPTRAGPA